MTFSNKIDPSTQSRAWPHHVYVLERPQSIIAIRLRDAMAIALVVVWWGLLSGLIEVAIQCGRHSLAGASSLGALQMNRHFLWMIPMTNIVIFMTFALPLFIFTMIRPLLSRDICRYLLIFLVSLSLLLMIRGLYLGAAALLAVGISFRISPLLKRFDMVERRVMIRTLPIGITIVGGLGFVSYDRNVLEERRMIAALPKAPANAPNVILMVLDTFRADRLSRSNSPRQTTPNLEKWGARGVTFQEARSAAPWTFPSHASMFTGRWPHELKIGTDKPLDGTFPTLAEFLASQGYETGGFVANTYFCNSWFGLGRGFAHYEDYYDRNLAVSRSEAVRCSSLGRRLLELAGGMETVRAGDTMPQKNAEQINDHFLDWIGSHKEHPFFAFLNYIDTHDPYIPPEGFEGQFGLIPETAEEVGLMRSWHVANKQTLTERDIQLAIDAYDDCVAYLDEQLGKLFDELEARGILENTLVIVTADHGEGFGEHNQFLHGKSLYREETHVPLLIFGPSSMRIPTGLEIDSPVTLRDLASTIAEQLGYADQSSFPGLSLARHWQSGATNHPELEPPILTEIEIVEKVSKNPNRPPAFRGPMASMIFEDHTYIKDAVGREELYRLKKDPQEKVNLVDDPGSSAILERLRTVYGQTVPLSHDRSRAARRPTSEARPK